MTGCTGYTGAHAVKALVSHDIETISLARMGADDTTLRQVAGDARLVTFRSFEDLHACLEAERPTQVIHCAGLSIPDPEGAELSSLLQANVEFGARLLDAMAKAQIKQFLWCGSYWQFAEGPIERPNSRYAASKIAFRSIARQISEAAGISWVELILYDSYGPDDPRGKILGLFANAAGRAESVAVSGGEQQLLPVWIDDVASAILAASRALDAHGSKGPPLAKSWGAPGPERFSLRQMAEIYAEEAGVRLNIAWGARPYPPHQIMRPQRVNPPPGWSAQVSFREGCRRIIERLNHE